MLPVYLTPTTWLLPPQDSIAIIAFKFPSLVTLISNALQRVMITELFKNTGALLTNVSPYSNGVIPISINL